MVLIDEIFSDDYGVKINELKKYMNNYEVYNDEVNYWNKDKKLCYFELKKYTSFVYHF